MSDEKWSESFGERPNTVTAYEREPGGTLYLRAWDPNARNGEGNWRRISLGHKDKKRAKREARAEVAKLEKGEASTPDKLTLARLFALYLQYQTPKKSTAKQKDDARRVELWNRVLGATKPDDVSLYQWDSFIAARSSGAIDSRGNPVAEKDRVVVRTRGVEIDLVWLRAVFTWATKWKENGRVLMASNPTLPYDIPREKNPRRPLATQDRYETIRAVTDSHTYEARWTGKRTKVRSHLSELLDIANGTGRRIEAICSLRFEDLRLERTEREPHGAIVWPGGLRDKERKEWRAGVTAGVRAALDRILLERPGIGAAPMFPAPGDPTVPMSRHLADKWLREAERMAGLAPLEGKLWHAYRGKWATERKNFAAVDVAALGGWSDTNTLKLYQQPDKATMLRVLLEPMELRDAR